jgi:DNA-directed RNA polymerase specialized sigma24 family protein
MQIEFAEHERLLRSMASKFHRRATAAGAASLQIDDVFQEMCVAWCQARDAYNSNYQVPFTAFLVRGVRNHCNRWINKQITEGQDKLELDADFDNDNETAADRHSVVADESVVSPEEAAVMADHRAVQREILSPLAQKFLEILENPPPAIYRILDAMQAKRAYAQSRGVVPGFTFKQIKAPLVFELMGLDVATREKIKKELQLYAALEEMAND